MATIWLAAPAPCISVSLQRVTNQREMLMLKEKMDSLYAKLQLRMDQKHEFLSECQGHSQSVINRLRAEVERLEEVNKSNIEKLVNNLRNELHKLLDLCFIPLTSGKTYSS